MFTGIVEELAETGGLKTNGGLYRLQVSSKIVSKKANIGDSVAVNGVCLTVSEKEKDRLSFDIMDETVKRTNLDSLKEKRMVNLESSIKAGAAMGGHFVLGHIDCVGRIGKIERSPSGVIIYIGFPEEYSHLVVEKGSIALNGVSLTIGNIKKGSFLVHLIPHTLRVTTLGSAREGDKVNLEFDIIGKFVARLNETKKSAGLTEEFLRQKGFF